MAPAGLRYEIDISLTFGADEPTPAPHYPAERVGPSGTRWVRGDCHLHTIHSDGARTPGQLAAAARAGGLDFVVSTDHNTTSSHRQWAAHAGDDLLIGLGEESTTRNGHWLALGLPPETVIEWRFRADGDGFAAAVERVHERGGLAVAAHPFAPCLGCRFKLDLADADVVEVWNGPWTLDDEAAVLAWDNLLVAGRPHWLPAPPVGIGGQLPVSDDALIDVHLRVESVADGLMLLVTDQGVVRRARCDAAGHGELRWHTSAGRSRYVRAEVRHPGTDDDDSNALPGPMAAMTNPIWLGGPARD